MRNLIDLIEGKKAPKVAPTVVDVAELREKISAVSIKLARSLSLSWDRSWADAALSKIKEMKARHDASNEREEPEDRVPFDASEEMIEVVNKIWLMGSRSTFTMVRAEISELEHEYQKRKGDAMDQEAGFESDFHFVESSDWLEAMTAQKDFAKTIDATPIESLADVERMIPLMDIFADVWTNYHSMEEEPIVADELAVGLSRLLPLLMLICR